MLQIDEQNLQNIMKGLHIPPQPKILSELISLTNSEDFDIAALAGLIEQDVEISGLILKTINSPIFAINKKISSIRQSVILLGLETVRRVAMACSLKQTFSGKSTVSLEQFWIDSIEQARLCQLTGELLDIGADLEMLYLLGLFHDCGIAVLALKDKNYSHLLKASYTEEHKELTQLEDEVYPSNHAVIGFCIASSWGLSSNIYNVILHHHYPKFLALCKDTQQKQLYAILRISTNIFHHIRHGMFMANWEVEKAQIFKELDICNTTFKDLHTALKIST